MTPGTIAALVRWGAVIVACILAFIPATIASRKGRNSTRWWVYGFLLFIVALIHSLLIRPDQKPRGRRFLVLAFLVDYVALAYLVAIIWYSTTQVAGLPSMLSLVREPVSFPWWGAALILLEITILWEVLGTSLGHRVFGIRLTGPDLRLSQRAVFLLAQHLSLASVVGVVMPLWDKESRTWAERLTGLMYTRVRQEAGTRVAWYRTSWGWCLTLITFFTLMSGVFLTEVSFGRFNWDAAAKMIRRLFRPDWAGELASGIELLLETIFMALMATLFAIPIAFSLSFLAARNLATGPWRRGVYTVLRVILSIMRSIEPIVWAIIFIIIVTPRRAPFAGVLALWIHSISDLTKLYSERLESIDQGPVEAITATGASRLQVILYGIVPQILNPYLSFTLYRWDINVRMATVIGVVGGGGIGQMLYQYIRLHYWERAAVLIVLVILTVWVMDYTSSKLRQRFEEGGGSRATDLAQLPQAQPRE